jgi:predicted small lipoprotein YifL
VSRSDWGHAGLLVRAVTSDCKAGVLLEFQAIVLNGAQSSLGKMDKVMKRVLLLVILMLTLSSSLAGCGAKAPSPEVQKQQTEEALANTQKGMEAMKDVTKQINAGKAK